MKKETVNHRTRIVLNQSQCPPAVRMFFLSAFLNEDGEFFRHKLPVLALRTDHCLVFGKQLPIGCYEDGAGLSVEDLMDTGWEFWERVTETHAIVLDEEYGLIESDNELMKMERERGELITLPWLENDERDRGAVEAAYRRMEQSLVRDAEGKKRCDEKKAAEGFDKMRKAAE